MMGKSVFNFSNTEFDTIVFNEGASDVTTV